MDGETNSVASSSHHNQHLTEEAQDERRRQIRDIMQDRRLSQTEKNKTIQSLMDGRRRSSCDGRRRSSSNGTYSVCSTEDEVTPETYVSSMAAAAAAAAEYYSSDDEGDAIMSEAGDDNGDNTTINHNSRQDLASYYGYSCDQSVASTISGGVVQRSVGGAGGGAGLAIPKGSYRQVHGRSFSLQDFTDTDRAQAAANTCFLVNDPAQVSRLMEQSRPPCEHYERNCTLISPCCGLAFGCRICHDDCPVLPPPISLLKSSRNDDNDLMLADKTEQSRGVTHHHKQAERRLSMPLELGEDEDNHHTIDRFAVREVICRQCYTRQSSKTNTCINCGIQFGAYHCNICNLWMSDAEAPYHCDACGFCRVGGRENFTHCHDCGMCIDALLFDDHNCKAGKYMSNCPICQEDLFSSRYASHEMPCGHAIHWHCFKELTSYDTRCPVCKKTAETPEHMATTWSAIAMGIALQPVPPDMARVVHVFCNDCEERSENQRWHFLGVRCRRCMSFNTNVEQIVMQGRDASDFLDQLEAANAREGGIPANISMPAFPQSSAASAAAAAMAASGGGAVPGGFGGAPANNPQISSLLQDANAAVAAVAAFGVGVTGVGRRVSSNNDDVDDEDDDMGLDSSHTGIDTSHTSEGVIRGRGQ